ncbi:MAG TPA: tyrosine-type recombinase/integrase [Vicinamibacterales bacterium]|nr:tyrosine-type recombinase/integrase [Vicinamibacterales bacterium]
MRYDSPNTSMRPVEVKRLRRCDVDLVKKLVHVRRSKNETSHRVIPLNASAIEAARECSSARISSDTPSPSTTSGQRASGADTTPPARC